MSVFLLIAGPALAVQTSTFSYQSSVDGTVLVAAAAYPDGAVGSPILVVMHGYTNTMTDVAATQILLAERGLFTVAPAMRGRNGSGGAPDDSAWEIADIVDAVAEVGRRFPVEADAGNVNVVGYSGGGGNVFGLMSKYPDTFRLAAAFFGMSDYGYDLTHGWYHYGGTAYQSVMRERIGGAPEDVPDRYMARSSLLAVRNNRYTTFQMYVDSEEATCPAYNDTAYVRIALNLAQSNVSLNMSTPDSAYRWYHGYPSGVPDLVVAFDDFVPGILTGVYPSPRFDRAGLQTVIGYVSVEPYTLVLHDGKSEVADLDYDVTGSADSRADAWRFQLASRTGFIPSLSLVLRGLTPLTSYTFEDEDLSHGSSRRSEVTTDAAGSLRLWSFLNTESRFTIYRSDAASTDDGFAPRSPVKVCPNPFRDVFSISSPGGNGGGLGLVRVHDVAGRLVLTAEDPGSGILRLRPDARRMPPGAYWLSIGSGPDRRTTRIVRIR